MYSKVIEEYERHFNQKPQFLVLSSGRVNLIGEHIDYHEGIVLPCAISLKNVLVGGSSEDYNAVGYSIANKAKFNVNIESSNVYEKGSSNSYIYGVCRSVIDSGHFIKGINFVIDGNLPVGSGLSSSASFCCGLVELISQIYKLNLSKTDIAKIARMAENNYVGVPCGIMDQMAIVFGRERNLVRIDCRDLSVSYCSMPTDVSIVVVNTMIKRQLAKSEYERRQIECKELLLELKKLFPQVKSLRDVSMDMLNRVKGAVNDTIYKRGRYVVEEIRRVDKVFEAMNLGNLKEIGRLFYEGHIGLRDDYEVSCDELNLIVDETYKFKEAIAARMTGAGFGGCAVTLIKSGFEGEFSEFIKKKYFSVFGKECDVYITGQPAEGLVSIKL